MFFHILLRLLHDGCPRPDGFEIDVDCIRTSVVGAGEVASVSGHGRPPVFFGMLLGHATNADRKMLYGCLKVAIGVASSRCSQR